MSTLIDKQRPIAGLLDKFTSGACSELMSLVRGMNASADRWALLSFPIMLIVVIAGVAAVQVKLNAWQGALYDALQRYDVNAFLHQLLVFLLIFVALLSLVISQTWLTQVFNVRLRAWLTRDLLDAWLRPKRAHLLTFTGEVGVNPDQRIQEDTRHWAELSADIVGGFTQSTLLLVSFIGVLWLLSEQVLIIIGGNQFTIPGFLVWCALAYSLAGLWLTRRVGRPLADLNAERYAREAEFRAGLVRIVEHADAIALYRGEAAERLSVDGISNRLFLVTRALAGRLVRLTWVTSGHGSLAIIVPFLMAAPGYFEGKLSFGSLVVIVGAFNQVLGALRWQVDNFSRIADWRATLSRVVAIREALAIIEKSRAGEDQILIFEQSVEKLSLEAIQIYSPVSQGDCLLLEEEGVELRTGDHVLVTAETGAARTSFFLALAGLWPWGKGTMRVPPRAEAMFLPQRPYLPPGRLRDTIAYPAEGGSFSDQALRGVLKRVGLENLGQDLERRESWDKHLSLEEQQALGFARTLLHAPRWVFLDDALAALDPATRETLLATFKAELSGTAVLSTGRGGFSDGFYGKVLHLRQRHFSERREK